MPKKIDLTNGKLTWTNDSSSYVVDIDNGTFINNDSFIMIMNENRDKVIVLDENNNNVCELCNSESIYLMYLQKHPRFGLSVVASVKDDKDDWTDKHISLSDNKFKEMSFSR